jgi:hypothetical protein
MFPFRSAVQAILIDRFKQKRKGLRRARQKPVVLVPQVVRQASEEKIRPVESTSNYSQW